MPKTIRNKYYKKLSYEKLMEAHIKSRKGKSIRKETILFNLKQEEYIMWLYEQLKNKTYKHGGYTEFYVTEPKLRKIEKSRYIDRIVHRWVVDNFLEPAFVPQFIPTSYACLKEKGMHRAALYVQSTMKHCKRIWGEYYILKMDVAKYFDNINKNILLEILKRKIKDKELLWLINQILFAQKREKGLEIGNYTSQMFANIYLNEVDQFIKHKLRIKYYCRYLDDSAPRTYIQVAWATWIYNNCIDDGSRSTENAIQVEFSNHSKVLYSKGMVLSVGEKATQVVRWVLRRWMSKWTTYESIEKYRFHQNQGVVVNLG